MLHTHARYARTHARTRARTHTHTGALQALRPCLCLETAALNDNPVALHPRYRALVAAVCPAVKELDGLVLTGAGEAAAGTRLECLLVLTLRVPAGADASSACWC